jgi:hypothetical protein
MPGTPKLLRIESIKVVFDVEQTTAKFARVQIFLRILASRAGLLDALEISGRHMV